MKKMFFEDDSGKTFTPEEVESMPLMEKDELWKIEDIDNLWEIDGLEGLPPWEDDTENSPLWETDDRSAGSL